MEQDKEAQDIVNGLEWAERMLVKQKARKCDWKNPADVALWRSQSRAVRANDLLDLLAPSRKCPNCGLLEVDPRQWRADGKVGVAVCVSCYRVLYSSYVAGAGRAPKTMRTVLRRACRLVPMGMVGQIVVEERAGKCRIDCKILARCRCYRGWSQARVAAGWMSVWTYRGWEDGSTKWVSVKKMKKISAAFTQEIV